MSQSDKKSEVSYVKHKAHNFIIILSDFSDYYFICQVFQG